MAHSIASAPELQKNTVSAKVASTRRLAMRFWAAIWNRLEQCQSFCACVVERRDQLRMRVAQSGDGDAAREIEVFPAVGGEKIGALAALERQFVPRIGRHDGWNHGNLSSAMKTMGKMMRASAP